jgi:hypothetical protein
MLKSQSQSKQVLECVQKCDIPSNLTGDLPYESRPLRQETLPPRDSRGRGPGCDLCSSVVSLVRSRSRKVRCGDNVLWPRLRPTMRPKRG